MSARSFGRVVVCMIVAVGLVSCGSTKKADQVATGMLAAGEAATYEYVIPAGTGDALQGDQQVSIMPEGLTVKVGESLRIINKDTKDYDVGPFFVAAGQTLAMRFTHKGILRGQCLFNPSGEFVLTVTD